MPATNLRANPLSKQLAELRRKQTVAKGVAAVLVTIFAGGYVLLNFLLPGLPLLTGQGSIAGYLVHAGAACGHLPGLAGTALGIGTGLVVDKLAGFPGITDIVLGKFDAEWKSSPLAQNSFLLTGSKADSVWSMFDRGDYGSSKEAAGFKYFGKDLKIPGVAEQTSKSPWASFTAGSDSSIFNLLSSEMSRSS